MVRYSPPTPPHIMKRIARLPAVLFLAMPFVVAAQPVLPGVAAAMQKVIDADEISGAVTAVVTKDGIVHLEATGLADIKSKRPMRPDALFYLASTTKPVTAVAVLMLQDEGKLNLADPVANYIPEIAALKSPSGLPANLTIAQLLTHTSGLAEHKPQAYSAATLAELIAECIHAPMRSEPNERWQYTSSGFDVAARIVEVVSGKSFDQFVQERLFDPLGMKSTTFFPSAEQLGTWPTVYLYRDDRLTDAGKPPAPVRGKTRPFGGAGLYATAGDLAIFCQMLLNRGELGGRRYLSESAYMQLTTIRTGELPTGFSKAQINNVLGWGVGVYVLRSPHAGVSDHLSVGTFGHPGALGTHILVDPVKGRAYVFLVQRPNMTDNFENEPLQFFLDSATAALDPSVARGGTGPIESRQKD